MNQINADTVNKLNLATATTAVGEPADLKPGIAYSATLARSSAQDPLLLHVGNRTTLALPTQSIPAPLRQVLQQIMTDERLAGPVADPASQAHNSNETNQAAPMRGAPIAVQVTITASQQLQLNPLSSFTLTPVQQLQVLQQLAGVQSRRAQWDVQLDKASIASKLTASELTAQQSGSAVTVRLQATPQQLQVQIQQGTVSAFQPLSSASQQQILSVLSEQLGGETVQWRQLPERIQQQFTQTNPALAAALQRAALPLRLNFTAGDSALQPATAQTVPLSASQFNALVPSAPITSTTKSTVIISEQARIAMANEKASVDAAQSKGDPKTAPTIATTRAEQPAPLVNEAALSETSSDEPPAKTATGAVVRDSRTGPSNAAQLQSEQPKNRSSERGTSAPITNTSAAIAGSMATDVREQKDVLRNDRFAEHTAPQANSERARPSTTPQALAVGADRSRLNPVTSPEIPVLQRHSGANSAPQQPVFVHSSANTDHSTLEPNTAAETKGLLGANSQARTAVSMGDAPISSLARLTGTTVQPALESSSQDLDVPAATIREVQSTKEPAVSDKPQGLPTSDGTDEPDQQPAHAFSKTELLRQLVNILTPLWQSKSTDSQLAELRQLPSPLSQLADSLAIHQVTTAQRPLLQQLQQAMLEPRVLTEAQLQQELNAALVFNPLQPATTTSAAGTLAVAMQLLLGRLGVPVGDSPKSERTQKLKDAVQLLDLAQTRDSLKQLASHASAYQAAQLETIAQQKPEQTTWYFQLPIQLPGQSQFAQMTVEQRAARKANGQTSQLWHLTLALEIPPYGRVVMEGALGPDANSLSFYTTSDELKASIDRFGVILRDRLKLQGVPIGQFQCTVGELPAHLANKSSSLLQVKV